ncbi:MAG: hypothetical protein COT18_06975 [Elusimicrobia bacterium CG08_land_8_20_14_0_20_59_10]|nr:MAG: hypothetical protein COT18_06975 [Elusimicrobia bacterium CG08_land_8_20_14_0_20_59_10]
MNYDDIKNKVDRMILNTVVPGNLRELIETGTIKIIAKSFYVENMQKLPKNVSTMISSALPTENGMRITFCRKSRTRADI